MPALESFVRGLPKAELHVHLEGTLEPEQLFDFARRNRVALTFETPQEVRAAYAFSCLQDFLDLYYQGAAVLRTQQDFHDLALAYFHRAAADGVRHVELSFDPQTHTGRGVPFEVVVEGVLGAMDQARRELELTSKLILCFLRHLPVEAAVQTLAEAEPWLDRITGVGLDSSELGFSTAGFAGVFAAAKDRGLRLVAHAGEEGPPENVWAALDVLRAERIDHGVRSLEDDALTRRLAADGTTLTVCPLSNVKLGVVPRLEQHPLRRMLELGLRATVNSDDPGYFGGYVGQNWVESAVALDLSRAQLVTLARNSFTGSFLEPQEVEARLAEIDAYLSDVPV